jgi:polyhydroxyalkanoate synthesis regulator phasin
MLDVLRRYVEAGREALTPAKAQEMARALVTRGEAGREQASSVARQLLEWSRRSSERFRETVRREVRRQIGRAGLATKAEVEALRRRVRELERSGSSPARKRTTRKAPARKTSSARKSTSRKSTAGRRKSASTRGARGAGGRSSAANRPPSGGGTPSG